MTSIFINSEDSCTVFCQECFAKLGTSRTRKAWPPHHIIKATGECWNEYQDASAWFANYLADEGCHSFVCDECSQRCCHVEGDCPTCKEDQQVWEFFGEEPTKAELDLIDSLIGDRRYHRNAYYVLRDFFDSSTGAWDALEIVKKLRQIAEDDEETANFAKIKELLTTKNG